MSDLPRFTPNPFRRNETPEISPLSSPLIPSGGFPRRLSTLRGSQSSAGNPSPPPTYSASFPRRFSTAPLLSEHDRKPSVAPFHGDLLEEQATRSRRKTWVKWLLFVTLFFAGLLAGVAIGAWVAPFARQTPDTTTMESTASAAPATHTDEANHLHNIGSATKTSTTSKVPSSTAVSQVTSTGAAGSYWQPTAGTTFQIQLSSVISSTNNLPANIAVYDTDLFDTSAATIAGLKAAGKKVICYFSAGTAENWRSDYSQFTKADLGADMQGWAGEKWVYTPSTNVRRIMLARLQLAKTKGCDGVDPDNIDVYGYGSSSGFNDLTQATAVDYMTYLANQAHALGLAIGLKNSGEIIPKLLPLMQWVISEQCVQYKECNLYQPFINANKPAFNIQYPFGQNSKATDVSASVRTKYCTTGGASFKGFTNVMKHQNLDAWLAQC